MTRPTDGTSSHRGPALAAALALAALAVLALCAPARAQGEAAAGPATAQASGAGDAASATPAAPYVASSYLHLEDPAWPYVDLLVERGVLRGLAPVVRPYRRAEVARAVVDALDAGRAATATERAWLEWLRERLRAEVEAVEAARGPAGSDAERGRVGVEFALEGTGMTQSHRDLLRPEGAARIERAVQGELRLAWPGVAAAARWRSDSYYRDDAQFRPRRVAANRFDLRAEDAYVEVGGRHVRVLVGRLYRNWAPARVQGTLLSDYAYSYDQVGLWAGGERLSLSTVVARLDDFPGGVRRYAAWHRLDWRPWDALALYAAESVLYGGAGRDFELEFLNPLSFWFTENENQREFRESANNNALVTAGFWWRAKPFLVLFGEFTLDDVQVDPGAPDEPTSYAAYAGLVLPRLGANLAARVVYSQVSSLAYRTATEFERYAYRDLGLGRDFSDHDLVTLELDWFPRRQLWLRPAVHLLRRGEGDFRKPWPESFEGVPTLHIGTVETTVRAALAGRAELGRGFRLEWDAGWNRVWDAGHVEGARRSEFVGRATLSWRGAWQARD